MAAPIPTVGDDMTKIRVLTAAAVLLLGSTVAADERVIDFDTMNALDGPFIGGANPIRGINGGGLPWVLTSGRGRVEADGKVDVSVDGLIIPGSVGFGFNPAPFFRLIVSCLTVDGGLVTTVNIMTNNGAEVMLGDPRNGDARFKTQVDLPSPCVAPIVFVASPSGAWFAASGQ